MRNMFVWMSILLIGFTVGCAPRVKLFSDASEPLLETVIQGEGPDKVLVINIQGVITDIPRSGFFRSGPSMVQEVIAQLRKCEDDRAVKAIIIKIDSPGGTTSASDILYHEILSFKKRTGKKVVAVMMNLATSGGYYVALPADFIMAHPTTLTGSIGAILIRPKLHGLMEKIGVEVPVTKSGRNKDILSPFRPATPEEDKILQDLIDSMGQRFLALVKEHRKIDSADLDQVASARVFIAKEAQKLGLVDKVGYLDQALAETGRIAGLSKDFRVIVYRRSIFENDNLYNTSTSKMGTKELNLLNVDLLNPMMQLNAGFYYLWCP